MTDSKTATELRGKLNKLIIELYHLDFMLDSPASNMTLGEYEQERERLLDEFVQAIVATLNSGECEIEGSYYYDDYDQYEFEFSCGHSVNMYDKEPPNYCPICGRKVKQ